MVWTAKYLPFGGVETSTGTPIALRFPGQWYQSESGLHQNWMRDYDPTTGRYLQADPLGLVDGASVYGYARQSPNRYSDPTGECIGPWAAVCAGAAIGFALDLAFQLYENDGNWKCVNWGRAGLAGAAGALGGGYLGGLSKGFGGLTKMKNWSSASKKFKSGYGRGYETHHGVFHANGVRNSAT